MGKKGSPVGGGLGLQRKVHPAVAGGIIAAVVLLCVAFGYKSLIPDRYTGPPIDMGKMMGGKAAMRPPKWANDQMAAEAKDEKRQRQELQQELRRK
jgi:hypothetical protein